MSLTSFPHGISSMGLPIVGGRYITTGDIHFVDSATGSNATDRGGDTDHAFADFDYSVGQCTPNKGDFTFIMPNHAETVTGAGGITLDVAGASFVGLGRYDQRPRMLMNGGTTVTMLVTAADCMVKNIVFAAGHSGVAIFAHISAKGFRLDSCYFEENTTNENWTDVIHAGTTDNDYDGLEIVNCDFIMEDADCVTAIELLKNSRDVKIIGNRIVGDFDASPFAPIYSASGEIHTNIVVAYNLIHNQHNGDAALCISIPSVSFGWIVHNHAGHLLNTGDTPFLGAADGLYMGENYGCDMAGPTSGYLYPAKDS